MKESQSSKRTGMPVPEPESEASDNSVPEWKRCRLCWNPNRKGNPGIGNVYSVHGRKRYMRCTRCRWTWSVEIDRVTQTVKIEHKEVRLDER